MRDFGGFYIVYPAKRYASAEWIQMQYEDAVANGQVDEAYLGATDHQTMANGLSDAGIITLGKLVDGEKAVKAAHRLTKGPASMLGMVKRVIITDGGDCINFEWKKGEGIVFPPRG